ncbi:MAG: DUF4271 domain-containing protein [Bacteroidales bacterium]|nr:DUF4271 domain-containing protein [Bacteroidales bacterium]
MSKSAPIIKLPDSIMFSNATFREQETSTMSLHDSANQPSKSEIRHSERFLTKEREGSIQFEPQPIVQVYEEWQVIALAFSLLAIAFIRITGKNFFKNLQSGFVSRPIFKQLFRDGQLIPSHARPILLLAFLMVFTVFLYQINMYYPFIHFNPNNSPGKNILLIIALLGSSEILIFLLIRLIGFIFKTKSLTNEFIANNIFYKSLAAIILLPLLLFTIFSSTHLILFFSLIIFLILFIIRVFRGMLIAFELRSFSFYQIFLYICTLEILPVFILLKTITGYFSRM